MQYTTLGRTGLKVSRTAFGALPIQRVTFDEARVLLRGAVEGGINFIDTARGYSDSEEKIGYSLADLRDEIYIATKVSGAKDRAGVLSRVETSLANMRTDHVDVLQLHNPAEIPDPDDPESTYAGLLEAQHKGMTRFIGITNHRRQVALEAARSGLFDTIQFPFSAISADADLELVALCKERDVGFIAMKAMSGGLITDSTLAFAALRRYENVVPIWGIQRPHELAEFLALEAKPPALTPELLTKIEQERQELSGDFCRGCGYCLPCPAEIPIPTAARIGLLLRRAPTARFLSPEFQEQMSRIDNCIECYECSERCPYDLDTPVLLKKMQADYMAFLETA